MKDLSSIAAEEQTVRGELKAVREKIAAARAQVARDESREAELLDRLHALEKAAQGAFRRARNAGLQEPDAPSDSPQELEAAAF